MRYINKSLTPYLDFIKILLLKSLYYFRILRLSTFLQFVSRKILIFIQLLIV